MSLNMKIFTQALAKTAAVIEKTVNSTVQEVTGPRPLQDYDLLSPSASGGIGMAWRIYTARPRATAPSAPYPLVSVWVVDKRQVAEARVRAGLSKAVEDEFLEICRRGATKLVRIRHPGVLHVVQALDESKAAMAMVTEPIFASVANAIGKVDNLPNPPAELQGMDMGLLEIKHGMLQVAETLDFLHNNAHMSHQSISPETVFITANGSWKLGGFEFSVSSGQPSGGLTSTQEFHYLDYDVEDSVLPLQPSLNYTAPELVRNGGTSVTGACDIFSFACVAYHLISRRPLLDCSNNVKMYMNTLTYLTSEAFGAIPTDLVVDLQRMLSVTESSRPSATDFTGSSFFRDDTRLRALRFLDHMLERDNMQKTQFLKALSDLWKDFDARVLRYKVLPPLCEELRNVVMQPMILPMVLTIAESQDKTDFELSTLPALVPVFTGASGDTLLLLTKNADLIISKANNEHLISYILPMLVRAYDDTDPRIQEEVLRRTVTLARQLDMQILKQAVLPRVHGLALKTTVAAVRVNALRCLGDLVPSLDKLAVLEVLQTLRRCTAVDHSAPTLMCTLGVANATFKQCGVEFAAEHVVPLLFPLLTAQQLSVQQFAKFMLFIKDIISKIEEKRGVTITDVGNSEVKFSPSLTNGLHTQPLPRQVEQVASAKSSSAWDEDWGSSTKKPTNAPSFSSDILQPKPSTSTTALQPPRTSVSDFSSFDSLQAKQPERVMQSTSVLPPLQSVVADSGKQSSGSCAPVDIEWPPRNIPTHLNNGEHNAGGFTGGTFDDLDPFADWPPKQSVSAGIPSVEVKSVANSISGSNMVNTGFAGNSSIGQMKTNQTTWSTMPTSTSRMPMNSGQFPQNTSSLENLIGAMGTGQPNLSSTYRPQLVVNPDFGSTLLSSNSGLHPTPKLAPPPTTTVGRGRGRNQGQSALSRSSRPTQSSSVPDQLNLLDLLQ